jgi:xylulose-5-phosphate/fructose-6-phosphate phosphoketolase
VELFTATKPVIFAYHGYQRAIHEIIHGHVNTDRFHVRGFNEEGTTTPFDMVALNSMSRYHLAFEALRRSRPPNAPELMDACQQQLARALAYSREHLDDAADIRDWVWTES